MHQVYLNRKWVEETEAFIPLNDGGFLRGDGIFESLLVEEGKVFRLGEHLDRLLSGLNHIRITSRESKDELIDLIREFIRRNRLIDAVIRIIITRGIYESLPWEEAGSNSIYITSASRPALPDIPAKIVFLDETRYPIIRRHPAIKSLNYLGNILAKIDANDAGAFEPVLYNSDGYITEGGVRNIFFVKDGTLLTPPVSLGILPGTMRGAVLDVAEQQGISSKEILISHTEVDTMDEAFLTSTSVKILPVTWDGWQGKTGVTNRLAEALNMFITKTRE